MNLYEIIKLIIVIIGLSISCYTDVKDRKILNKVTFTLMLVGIIINILEMSFIDGSLFSIKGMLFVFLACIVFSVLGGFGFGDTKLLMGIASIYGLWFSFDVFLFSLLTMVGYFVIFKFKMIKDLFINLKNMIMVAIYQKSIHKIEKEQSVWSVPYACFITLGFLLSIAIYFIKGENLIWSILN